MIPKNMNAPGGHEWVMSTVGHGEYQCKHCLITNREAWALDELDKLCPARAAADKEENPDD